MDSNRSSETFLSQRDLPLWARGVAAGLLLFASWWLLDTEGIRSVVGDSVGALCLGVIAASILQGMHLPLALWPDGPWRKQFSVSAVVATAAVLALMILIARTVRSGILANQIDVGTGISVVVGTVGIGFAVGFVKQRRYLAWYGIALGLALLPLASELAARSLSLAGAAPGLSFFFPPQNGIVGGEAESYPVGLVPALVFLTAIGAATKVVTEEIAFRRILIGVTTGAGLLSILGSALTALLWYVVLFRAGVGDAGLVVLGTLGAVSAGCLYVLSKSLLVSGFFSALYTAGYWSLELAIASDSASAGAGAASPAMWIAASLVTVALAVIISNKNGFFGNLRGVSSTDVTSS